MGDTDEYQKGTQMSEASVIPEDVKKLEGKEVLKPAAYEVEKGAIRRFFEAVEDENPLWHDEKTAQEAGYDTCIAPPMFINSLGFPQCQAAMMDLPLSGGRNRVIADGIDYEFFLPVRAGDKITVTTVLAGISERETKMVVSFFF